MTISFSGQVYIDRRGFLLHSSAVETHLEKNSENNQKNACEKLMCINMKKKITVIINQYETCYCKLLYTNKV